jgi:hypothetical protein
VNIWRGNEGRKMIVVKKILVTIIRVLVILFSSTLAIAGFSGHLDP